MRQSTRALIHDMSVPHPNKLGWHMVRDMRKGLIVHCHFYKAKIAVQFHARRVIPQKEGFIA